MAKNKKIFQQPPKSYEKSAMVADFQRDWSSSDNSLSSLREMWDENEKIFLNLEKGKLGEQTTKSNVNDGHLSTAIVQRTQRIMAQPPSGKVQSLDSKNNRGKSMLMDYLLRFYVEKNANSQYSFLTKLKLWTIYSQVYGSMPVLLDYVVSDAYLGPDFWLIPIRQFYPQPGVFQVNDMDFCYVDSFVSIDWLKKRPKATWKGVDDLLLLAKEKMGKAKSSYPNRSFVQEKWGGDDYGAEGEFAQVLLRTRYERDRWITYAPDYEDAGVLREIDNPHQNNQLPIIMKETIPLLDRYVGWGDVERGAPLQKATNSLINLYLDANLYSLFPPTIVNKNGVVPSSIRWEPGAFWYEMIPNSIRSHQVSPSGQNTFNNSFGVLVSMLNNLLGTTDLSTIRNIEPMMGKTPQALKMQSMKESAADSWERQSLEEALEQLYDRMVDLLAVRQEKPIDLNLFRGEIEEIRNVCPDVVQLYDEESRTGKLRIKPEAIRGKYKFFIDSGSTMVKDMALENQSLTGILSIVLKTPQIIESMRQKGKDIDLAELVKRWVMTSGIENADQVIVDYRPEPGMEGAMGGQPGEVAQQGQPGELLEQGQPGVVPQEQMPTVDLSQINDPAIRQVAEQLFGQGGGNVRR